MSCVNCGRPVVRALAPDTGVEAGESPSVFYCAACWRLRLARDLVADGKRTDYPGFKHGGADMQQPGDANRDFNRAVMRALIRPNAWYDGREMGE
ncbi:MAG: hypothetical protein IVW57_03180 [Ktedonobacterales bacterium]|nr:hypothetical protein [Ktedonobacterales bacterium]